MHGLQTVRFAKTAAPNANWGRQLERVGVPGTACAKPAEPKLPYPSRQKLEAEMMKPQVLRENCGLCRRVIRETNLGHIFFDVDLRGSIAAEISVGQAAWIGCFIFVLLTKARPLKSHI